ncbi:MAG TPA: type IV pilus biogenesis/stability protein PilW, partial [Gammaproteobacteria bacterium]|nr:type IV pilus biogenesis/stability protein PilW [Gammaproteobacteria bacterium]
KLGPDLPEVHYALGYYKESMGEVDQAKDHYLEALRKKPKHGIAHNNYGAFLCRQGHYQEAEKEFLTAVEDPEYTTPAEALENAGLCVLQIPDVKRAQEHLERSVRMDPKRFSAILELSMINYQNKKYSTSLEYFSLFAQQADHSPRSLWLGIKLAEHYQDQKRLLNYKKILKEKFPQSAEYKFLEKNTS